ncbi:ribosome biogenesis GTPase YqeH [Fructilactobacillus myrtifloralis]|uniref:Ribosome biogenesis GTPase YqeH n=1 Tax=Fructilactobacillus myrtifloralis TaxID=2940301 RepID=A0ABY5BSL3_9LACO|nr:ribosome biogenesis GTPase YqeH [Fructilactobacillus myrtifloralis]USS85248.1 ribosome biogenesis GTPase YqeH [Fructilactobacillus myrtifloralis]
MDEKRLDEEVAATEPLFCIGCGAQIQTTDKTAAGYTPSGALEKGLETGELYCQRCFRLRHYNEIQPVSVSDDEFLNLLSQIGSTDSLVVYVVDIFDVNGSLIPGLQRFVGKNPVLVVGNKVDLLPSSFKPTKVKDWLRQTVNRAGLRPVGVELVSAKTNQAVDDLLTVINRYAHDRDVYVVGVTNVGKSTLINQIIHQSSGERQVITTSKFPGTTLDLIKIPLDNGHLLIDTPGIIHSSQMAHYLSSQDLKYVSPQKRIKPRVYQLNSGQTLFWGAVGRFDYLQGPKAGFTVYVDNNLMLHRTKLENADEFFANHAGGLLKPPEGPENVIPLQRHEFKVTDTSDLVIEGLGWVTVPKGSVVAGWAPKGVAVLIRKSMF